MCAHTNTHRDTQIHTDPHRDRVHAHIQPYIYTNAQRNTHTDTDAHRQTDTHTNTQTHTQTNTHRDKLTCALTIA